MSIDVCLNLLEIWRLELLIPFIVSLYTMKIMMIENKRVAAGRYSIPYLPSVGRGPLLPIVHFGDITKDREKDTGVPPQMVRVAPKKCSLGVGWGPCKYFYIEG